MLSSCCSSTQFVKEINFLRFTPTIRFDRNQNSTGVHVTFLVDCNSKYASHALPFLQALVGLAILVFLEHGSLGFLRRLERRRTDVMMEEKEEEVITVSGWGYCSGGEYGRSEEGKDCEQFWH